jgi:hypothetical protein
MADSLQFIGVKDKAARITEPEAVEVVASASRSAAYSSQGDTTPHRDRAKHDDVGCSPPTGCQNGSPFRLETPLLLEHRVEVSDLIRMSGISVDQRASNHTWSTVGLSVDTHSRRTRLPGIESEASPGDGNAVPTEAVLSMLRTYRYHVAPWVSEV